MRELSLYSGAGGGLYGSKLLDWSTIGYVEFNEYCQKVIAQRIEDGIFDRAPIFTDVREFVKSGAARAYQGFVDVVSGGFPCQPFSVAGKREASNDERDMWPATMDVIKAVKPPIVFLENVPGLLSATVDNTSDGHFHYFGTILRDLAESGYNVKWCVLGADDVGANHVRKRLWILAHASGARARLETHRSSGQRWSSAPAHESTVLSQGNGPSSSKGFDANGEDVSDTHGAHEQRMQFTKRGEQVDSKSGQYGWWKTEPGLGRVVDGLAGGVNKRLQAIGNGQVSLTMACAYEILSNEFAMEVGGIE